MKFSSTFILSVAAAVQLASAAPILGRAPTPSGLFAPIPTIGGLPPAPDLDSPENGPSVFDVFPGLTQPLVASPDTPITLFNSLPIVNKREATSSFALPQSDEVPVVDDPSVFEVFPGLNQPLVVSPNTPFLTGLTPVTLDRRLKFLDPCTFPVGFKGLIPPECTAPNFVSLPTLTEEVQPSADIPNLEDVRKRVNSLLDMLG